MALGKAARLDGTPGRSGGVGAILVTPRSDRPVEGPGRVTGPGAGPSATAGCWCPRSLFTGGRADHGVRSGRDPRSGLDVQACGDAHLSNFGVFASAERNLVFDVNDFDETLPVLGMGRQEVGRQSGDCRRDRGFSDKERADAVLDAIGGYRTEMTKLAAMRDLDVWYARMDIEKILEELGDELGLTGKHVDKSMSKVKVRAEKGLAKARTRDSMQALAKLTEVVDGETRFINDPPLLVPIEELVSGQQAAALTDWMHGLLRSYRHTLQSDRRHLLNQFRFVSIAEGGRGRKSRDPGLGLAVGGERRTRPAAAPGQGGAGSVLAQFVGASQYENQGERVVAGQHLMQASSDIFLGWDQVEGIDGVQRDFYVRQLRDWKGSVDTDQMIPQSMAVYGRLCGWTLARAHARSGDRIAIAAYLGSGKSFDNAIVTFSETYADQNQRDIKPSTSRG